MPIYRLGEHAPHIPASAYVAEGATIIGKVILGERASVWPGAVLRGDNEPIVIGDDSNIQESCTLHTDPGCPLTVGVGVTVGHQVMLHGCTVGDGSLIGIQAVVLNKAVIGKQSLVGAGAIVTENKNFPDGSLILGAPAKVVRELGEADLLRMKLSSESYVRRGQMFKDQLVRIG
jgi:carbonic anhydrase/acetyltransferase-like protein (isoleucine patch superfamily)